MPQDTSAKALRHILSADQFDPELIAKLFRYADDAGQHVVHPERFEKLGRRLNGQILYRLFYKESTRTYESFGFAATHLGMNVLGTQSVQFSSVAKGETLEDTIRTINSYLPSMIVLRSASIGEAAKAAVVSDVPVINAGDGSGEHPTQALLDLYTIERELGRTTGLHIVMGGDLANGRTARSLTKLASKYPDNTFTFVAPPTFEMGEDIRSELDGKHIKYEQTPEVIPALATADIVYWTRVQKERITEEQAAYLKEHPDTESAYSLGLAEVKHMPAHAKLMHPLPRVGEIKPEVDADPRAVYFKQMHYGMLVRMGLIEYVLGILG
jgi:aspartate carbamoyltransferase catalytic subunit